MQLQDADNFYELVVQKWAKATSVGLKPLRCRSPMGKFGGSLSIPPAIYISTGK